MTWGALTDISLGGTPLHAPFFLLPFSSYPTIQTISPPLQPSPKMMTSNLARGSGGLLRAASRTSPAAAMSRVLGARDMHSTGRCTCVSCATRPSVAARAPTRAVSARDLHSSRPCMCQSCCSGGAHHHAQQPKTATAAVSSTIGSAVKKAAAAAGKASTSKAAGYATAAGPVIPTEQWAQVLEKTGGRK